MALLVAKHETCREYVKRRQREGWRIVSHHGHFVVLGNPEGTILREVDLMKDTLTLVPNGAGDYTALEKFPNTGEANWQDVDDPVGTPDEDATFVANGFDGVIKDAYALANTAQTGTINSVRVYFRCKGIFLV